MGSLDTDNALGRTDAFALWSRHPKASTYRHRNQLGLPAEAIVSAPGSWVEHDLSTDALAGLGDAPIVACAAALHLLVQHLCADEESLVAVTRPSASQSMAMAVSYVYAEADDDAASVHMQIARCLESEETVDVMRAPELLALRTAPAFLLSDSGDPPPAPVVLVIVRDGVRARLRLGVAPEVPRFPDLAATLAALDALLAAFGTGMTTATVEGLAERISAIVHWPATDAADVYARGIAELWSELLNVESTRIGPQTNYFELGGTSLNAFKLVAMVRSRFEVEINIRDIIDHDSLSAFAGLIERKVRDA